MPRPALNVMQLLTSTRWAMRQAELEQLISVVNRDVDGLLERAARAGYDEESRRTPQADIKILGDEDDKIRKRRALFTAPATEHAKSPRLGVRDGVAIVPVIGPMVRYASWIQEVCGLTSTQLAAMDFRIAIEDPTIRAILVHFDTAGGEVNGCSEFAELLFQSRGKKPIVAMVSDGAASAGYWAAAACDTIVVSPAAYVGSLGVYFELNDDTEYLKQHGFKRIRIVSPQSPNKVPDPETEQGRAVLVREAAEFGDAFLESVARYRSCTVEDLMKQGDAGSVHVGRHAVEHGLADRVATTEEILAELARGGTGRNESPAKAQPPAATTNTTESAMKKDPAAAKAATDEKSPRALKAGDEVTVKVTREVKFTEGAKVSVVEVRDNVSAVAVKEGDEEKRWLLADELEGGTAAAPAEKPAEESAAGDTDEEVKDEPEAVTKAFPKASAAIGAVAAAAERERIVGILKLPGALEQVDAVQACIADPACTRAQAAEKMLAGRPASGFSHALKAFIGAEATPAPSASNGSSATAPSRADEIMAARDLARGKSQ